MPINFLKGTFYHGFSVPAFEPNKSLAKYLRWKSYSALPSMCASFASMMAHASVDFLLNSSAGSCHDLESHLFILQSTFQVCYSLQDHY